jgi:hypothetical protein
MSRVSVYINNVHFCNVDADLVTVKTPIKSNAVLPLTTLNSIRSLLEDDVMCFEAEAIINAVEFLETIPYAPTLGDKVLTCDIKFNLFTTPVVNFLTEDATEGKRLSNFLRDRMWRMIKTIVESKTPNITIPLTNSNPSKFKFANRLLNETQYGSERAGNVVDFDEDISKLKVIPERKDVEYFERNDTTPHVVGGPAFVSLEEAFKRFRELTLGLLEPKDLAYACVAGGGVMKCLSPRHDVKGMPRSDVDIFVYGGDRERSRKIICDLVTKFSKLGDVYFGIRGSLIDVYIKDYPRTFQIISINCRNYEEVITRFDLSYIQMCVVGINGEFRFKATLPAIYSHITGTSSPANVSRLRAERVVKSCMLGFKVARTPRLMSIDPATKAILDSPEAFENCRNVFYAQYIPTSMKDISEAEERKYICSMISKTGDKKYAFISQSVQFACDNISYEGDFSATYEGMSIETFKLDQIEIRNMYGGNKRLRYATTRKEIKLLTDEMEIIDVRETDESFKVVLSASVKLTELGVKLNNEIYPRINAYDNNGGKYKNVKDGKYIVEFPLEQIENGKPPLRNTRGNVLSRDNIQIGNKVKLLVCFNAVCIYRGVDNGVVIQAKCLIRTDMDDSKVIIMPEQTQIEKKLETGSVMGIAVNYDSDEDE